MAGAMAEILAVARLLDDVARCLIHLPALELRLFLEGLANPSDGCITGSRHDLKDLLVSSRHFLPDEARPRQIAIYGIRSIELGPEVDQHEITFSNGCIGAGSRRVMRIAAVGPHAADRGM